MSKPKREDLEFLRDFLRLACAIGASPENGMNSKPVEIGLTDPLPHLSAGQPA